MTKNNLEKILSEAAENASRLFKKYGSLAPVLIVYHTTFHKGEEIDTYTLIPVTDMSQRDAIMHIMGKMFLKENKKVHAIAFVSEGWMSVQDEKNGSVNNLLPSQDPNRIEIVNITGMTAERESAMLVYEIKNKDDAKKRKLEKNDKASSMSKIENRLLDRFWQGMGMVVVKGS